MIKTKRPSHDQLRVAALCVDRHSAYHDIEGVDCYDIERDARSFDLSCPVIAHPPCRAWSAFCAHQAKPLPGERELALWCCDVLRKCGGVLEQPAYSRLFEAGNLPLPGERVEDLWSIAVSQSWFGHPATKRTWLCICGVTELPEMPYVLHDPRGDRERWNRLSKRKRSHTGFAFAQWLVEVAQQSKVAVS